MSILARMNWVHSVRRQLISTHRYSRTRYSPALGISATSGQHNAMMPSPVAMVARPFMNTELLSWALSRPKRMTA